MDEHVLIDRVLAGDPSAERELYDAQVDRVHGLAYRLTGDADLAREFTQETFIRAFDRLETFRRESALSTWLHAITLSVTRNGMRRIKRWRSRELEIEHASGIGVAGGSRIEPDLKDRLKDAIDDLPAHQREVFVLHEVEGYKHEEIAAMLDVAAGTSKARLSRARARLREELAEFAEEFVT